MIAPVFEDYADVLAQMHAAAFKDPWDAAAFKSLVTAQGAFALAADGGFILVRVTVDEAEILTLAVKPEARRQGLGRRLVEAGADRARGRGAAKLFLEVAADNDAATGLYRGLGFKSLGRRRGYYKRLEGPAVDALVLCKALNLSA